MLVLWLQNHDARLVNSIKKMAEAACLGNPSWAGGQKNSEKLTKPGALLDSTISPKVH